MRRQASSSPSRAAAGGGPGRKSRVEPDDPFAGSHGRAIRELFVEIDSDHAGAQRLDQRHHLLVGRVHLVALHGGKVVESRHQGQIIGALGTDHVAADAELADVG